MKITERKHEHSKAFTLIEVIVIIIIVSIIAGIAFPNFSLVMEKSKTAEAFNMLGSLHQAQRAYFFEFGRYSETLDDMDAQIPVMQHFNPPTLEPNDASSLTTPNVVLIERNGSEPYDYTLGISGSGVLSCVAQGMSEPGSSEDICERILKGISAK